MIIWMEVTRDKYELPLAVADSAKELAEMVGTTTNNIRSSVCHHDKGRLEKGRFRKVRIKEEAEWTGKKKS